MHNPLHQQLQQQEQLRSQHVQQQQAVSRSQVTVHPTYTFTPSVVSISGTGLVTAIQVPIPLHKPMAGCISLVSSDIVNAQPATPSAPISGTVTQPTCVRQQQVVSDYRLYCIQYLYHTK
jgi:hypothetical protein